MNIRKREIARAGIFGSQDNPRIVTRKDIKEIAETFKDIKTAPVQFGHASNAAAPRLGTVVSVYCDPDGGTLSADIEEDAVLAAAVDQGYYPDVSIGAKRRASDGKLYLRHLAYLGQESPAVKGLIAGVTEPLGIAAADTDGLVLFPPPTGFCLCLSEPVQTPKQNFLAAEEEAAKLREENERLKEELKNRDIALADSLEQKNKGDIERLKAAVDTGGLILPLRERILQIAGALEPGKSIELSDGSKQNPIDALIRVAAAIPPPVQTGALNLGEPDKNHSERDYSRLRNKG